MNELLIRMVGIGSVMFALALSAGAQTPDQSSNPMEGSSQDTRKAEQGADIKPRQSDDAGAAGDSAAAKDSGDDGMGEMHEEGRMDQDGASKVGGAQQSTKPGAR